MQKSKFKISLQKDSFTQMKNSQSNENILPRVNSFEFKTRNSSKNLFSENSNHSITKSINNKIKHVKSFLSEDFNITKSIKIPISHGYKLKKTNVKNINIPYSEKDQFDNFKNIQEGLHLKKISIKNLPGINKPRFSINDNNFFFVTDTNPKVKRKLKKTSIGRSTIIINQVSDILPEMKFNSNIMKQYNKKVIEDNNHIKVKCYSPRCSRRLDVPKILSEKINKDFHQLSQSKSHLNMIKHDKYYLRLKRIDSKINCIKDIL